MSTSASTPPPATPSSPTSSPSREEGRVKAEGPFDLETQYRLVA